MDNKKININHLLAGRETSTGIKQKAVRVSKSETAGKESSNPGILGNRCPSEKRGGAVQDSSAENNLHGRGKKKSGDLQRNIQADVCAEASPRGKCGIQTAQLCKAAPRCDHEAYRKSSHHVCNACMQYTAFLLCGMIID
ncbi:hypothetical protein Baya_5460 [Bagarius yarrelli]|uniref:Uncharacterized protein n=1 Tax=Bagarius yarrelli TaxID=175774 RepID=A0A556TUR7_BAGYA|nr:hypothetical protein Baya_5460 [Bagarius yarrelli]